MAFSFSPKIVTNGLVAYYDVNNPKCVDTSQSITADTRLNNLAKNSTFPQLRPNTSGGNDPSDGNMTFVLDNGHYVYDQDGVTGFGNNAFPSWKGVSSSRRVDDYTFMGWYKFLTNPDNTASVHQRHGVNIYGGGFESRTSFYLSVQGFGNKQGVLRYSNNGNSNENYTVNNTHGANDNEWHMFASTDTGGDSAQITKLYIDGVHVQTRNLSTHPTTDPHPTPKTDGRSPLIVWGGWSPTYGNFTGRTNCFGYYERVLSDAEILQNYNALKPRFI